MVKRIILLLNVFLLCFSINAQDIIISQDFTETEIRTKRVELGLEVNHGVNLSGDLYISFGTNTSSLTTQLVATVSSTQNYDPKTDYLQKFTFSQDNLTANTSYYYRWQLSTNENGTFYSPSETGTSSFTTLTGFNVLPLQVFEIPEDGLKVGDTIGKLKYDDTDGSWQKVQTYYKTSVGLKTDGTLWAWGRNAKRLITEYCNQSQVIYEPVKITIPPNYSDIDSDGDGYWNIDETTYGSSNPSNGNSKPTDSDGDYFSDAFETHIGSDPNDPYMDDTMYNSLCPYFFSMATGTDLYFHDFAVSKNAVLAIEKDTRDLYFWGTASGGIALWSAVLSNTYYGMNIGSKPISGPTLFKNMGWQNDDQYYVPTKIQTRLSDQTINWEKVAISENFATPKYPNTNNNLSDVYDSAVAAITSSGTLYIWGIVDGFLLNAPMQVGPSKTWVDVSVGDAIIAIADDGTMYSIDMDIPTSANLSTLDKDNDGVPDVDDAFEWDPSFQYDSDDDGLPNKVEDQIGTSKTNSDTDGDGVTDAQDQLPLNSNYSVDKDHDGLAYELDPNDDNWDTDGDGVPDGEDADPQDSSKKWDCDGDGVADEDEWEVWADPCVLDTDGDGVDDKDDKYPRTYHYKYDTDNDGLPDALEAVNGTSATSSDTDSDGYMDAIAADKFETFRQAADNLDCSNGWDRCDQWLYFWRFYDLKYDCDGDGRVSWEEWEGISPACQNVTPRDDFPTNANYTLDTDRDGEADEVDLDDDNDGFSDIYETDSAVGTDPKDWNSTPEDNDFDMLPDGLEVSMGTDPFNYDTDGDGSADGWDSWPLDPTIAWDQDKDKLEDWEEEVFLNTSATVSDTDGDGVDDYNDAFPTKSWTVTQTFDSGTTDTDGDGMSDAYEDANGLNKNSQDTDGDGYKDCACDPNRMIKYTDTTYGYTWWEPNWRQCEGEGGNWAFDKVNDRWYNVNEWKEDKFPTNSSEWSDYDGDGIGDNSDLDSDNDGIRNKLTLYVDLVSSANGTPNLTISKPASVIPMEGLILVLDASDSDSYSGSGSTWNDLSGQNAHAEAVNLPSFGFNGESIKNFDFDGSDDEFHSVAMNQEYRDLIVISKLERTSNLPMLFGHYNNLDDSMRFNNGRLSSNPDQNDWHKDQTSNVFINGQFNRTGYPVYNNWNFIRSYRSNNSGFGSSFRYELSSSFLDRRYEGKINLILAYNRKLSNQEVTDIYNAVSGRLSGNASDIISNSVTSTTYTLSPTTSNSTFSYTFDEPYFDGVRSQDFTVSVTGNNSGGNSYSVTESFTVIKSLAYSHTSSNTFKVNSHTTSNSLVDIRVEIDAFPLNPNEWTNSDFGHPNSLIADYNGNGVLGELPNSNGEYEINDEVSDLFGDNQDLDDDGDGFYDVDETYNGTDSKDWNESPSGDNDGDGFSDAFETSRGSSNNDWDSDNDGFTDGWKTPNLVNENAGVMSARTTSNFSGNNLHIIDYYTEVKGFQAETNEQYKRYMIPATDLFPTNANEALDNDGDGTGDNADSDDDNDGLNDAFEMINKRPSQISDYNSNGVSGESPNSNGQYEYWAKSNPYLIDSDNDGVNDDQDGIPWDKTETVDSDGDYWGDNQDWDDDNDGLEDSRENSLGLDSKNPDSDGDGWSDGCYGLGFAKFDSNLNWQKAIKITSTSTSTTMLGEQYKIMIEGQSNWDNAITVSLTTETTTYTVSEMLINFRNQINNNYSQIPYKYYVNNNQVTATETITASISGTTLLITGSDTEANIYLQTWDWWGSINIITSECDWRNEDRYPNNKDEWQDRDWDNISDNEDLDDDNDGLSDIKEAELGTNPHYWDSDGDEFGDDWDQMPLDPNSFEDTDGDGIPDATWTDLNGDGRIDPWSGQDTSTIVDTDIDGDGLSNTHEENVSLTSVYWADSDYDGYDDGIDEFPRWDQEHIDTDNDGIGNNWDFDDDGDGFSDLDEIFSKTNTLSPTSYPSSDQDNDKASDEYELKIGTQTTMSDTDGDGINDGIDVFPLNKNEWLDSDADGEGDNQDFNDDNDYYPDEVETYGTEKNLYNLNSKVYDHYEWPLSSIEVNPSLPVNADQDRMPDVLEQYLTNLYKSSGPDNKNDDNDWDNDGDINWNDPDSDGDGTPDGYEFALYDNTGTEDLDLDFLADNNDPDMDGDGLNNQYEQWHGTSERNPDFDGDGVLDGADYLPLDSRITSSNQINSSIVSLTQISGSNWSKISTWNYGQSGASYAAVTTDKKLYVWGLNYGSLPTHDSKSLETWLDGENYGYVIPTPTQVRTDESWSDVALGFNFGVGHSDLGELYSWGRNLSSQLGKGKPTTFETFSKPKIVMGKITDLTAGEQQAGIINVDGKLRMIGSNDQGQLGTGATNDNTPKQLDWDAITSNVTEVKVTETETQILTNSQQIWAYGDNLYAQLGRGNRSLQASNYEAQKINEEGWTQLYAISEHVYAFKSDGTLWAWGKNKNFDLGLGTKSDYVSAPTKVEGVNLSDIKDFSPVRGGFVYIKNNGELWGAGSNFYTGSWFPLSVPTKIGKYSDWSHFHDFLSTEQAILIEKNDGSIWGAGANWYNLLTDDPCPDPRNQIDIIEITHPLQKQNTEYQVSMTAGIATFTLNLGTTVISVGNVTNTTSLISKITTEFNANNTLKNNFTLTTTPTNSGSSTLLFEAKNYTPHKFGYSIIGVSSTTVASFTGAMSFSDTVKNISGSTTFTIVLNGIRIEASASSAADAITNLKTAIENSNRINSFSYSLTASSTKLIFENIENTNFNLTAELQNSATSSSSISNSTSQTYITVDCNPGFVNDLTPIFDAGNNWDKISLGLYHAIGLDDNGKIYSWGANTQGQLGLGNSYGEWSRLGQPTLINTVSTTVFSKVDASSEVSFAITASASKTMYAWGDNDLGTLAVGDYSDKNVPTEVKGNIKWNKNLGGFRFQVALDENNNPYGWGYRKLGQLGALGKVKGDDIVWDTDMSASSGIVSTTGDFITVTAQLVNYIETVLNFEYSPNSGKKQTVQKSSNYSATSKGNFETRKNVGKWKVKKKKTAFPSKSAIQPGDDASSKTAQTTYNFEVVDVNEKPSNITLNDISSSKISRKGEQFISNITVTDPDLDDIIEVTIPSSSPNADKFQIKNQKLYYNCSSCKSNTPLQVIIRATDWEGLVFEKQFEVLVDDDGLLSIEEVQNGQVISYDSRFIDTDGDGFVDADEMLIGTDQFDFRSFPLDTDQDGILDFYDGDADNDGYLNEDDQYPLNSREWVDNDNDGIPDNQDYDDDNDGIPDLGVNWREDYLIQDIFPNDPNETSDFDRDGIGDNGDLDDDNDGYNDDIDAFPFNPYEWLDSDNDLIGNNEDEDNDNDGYSNFDEILVGSNPLDPNDTPPDLDNDFVMDSIDLDMDGDGVPNNFDNAPRLYNPDQSFDENENFIPLVFPEFFSPNGDGINDLWVLGEIERYSSNKVSVYDTSGVMVFSKEGYQNLWDGTFNGVNLPAASYLYVIDVDNNGTIDFKGWVYITR